MSIDRSLVGSRQVRSFLPAVFGTIFACLLTMVSLAAEAPRMTRAEAFLGIHFDFHAGDDCDRVGARTTPEMVQTVIDKVQPDYLQIDCKGHRGYSSYPTKVGQPAPGFVGDPLRIWREVTRQRGIPLFMHYSGVWDDHAVATHPPWAAVKANGQPAAPIDIAVCSDALCHLQQIAVKLRRKLQWDPEREAFVNDDEANQMLDRPMRAPWSL